MLRLLAALAVTVTLAGPAPVFAQAADRSSASSADDGTAPPASAESSSEEAPASSAFSATSSQEASSAVADSSAASSPASSPSSLPQRSVASPPASSLSSQKHSSLATEIASVRSQPSSGRRSSASSVSSASSAAGSQPAPLPAATASGWFLRERFGYDVPVIPATAIAHPSEVSRDPAAIAGNALLALLFTAVLVFAAFVFGHLQETAPKALRRVLLRLPFQALLTAVIVWLLSFLVPAAAAQGEAPAAVLSLYRIPLVSFVFFVVVGATNTLFDAVLAEQSERLDRLFRPFLARLSARTDIRRKAWFIALFILLYGLAGGYIHPEFALLPARQPGIIIVTTATVLLSAFLKDVFVYVLAGRWHCPRWFQANIAGLFIAVACVVLSRVFALQPGYIYGIPVGLFIGLELGGRREGFLEFWSFFWLTIAAIAAWMLGPKLAAFPVLADLANVLYVVLIEAVFIELLPLPRFGGMAVFRWRRLLWTGQFAIVTFLAFHTLWNPTGTLSVDEVPPALGVLLLLGSFFVGVLVVWGSVLWMRRRQ